MNSRIPRVVRATAWSGALMLSLILLLALRPGPAGAEDWVQAGTIPAMDSTVRIYGVNSEGTVVGTRNVDNTIHRWPATGGDQAIGTAAAGCSIEGAGISDTGIVLGSQRCFPDVAATWQGMAWGPSSTVPSISNIPAGMRINRVAPDGKFIGTNFHDNFVRMDDQVYTGIASIDPQTGLLLVGTTLVGPGFGLDISNDGSIFYGMPGNNSGTLPDSFFRDGGPSGPYMQRASETFEMNFGFLPDEKVLARVAGPTSDPDPATDEAAMKIVAYEGVTAYDVPMTGGGLSARPMQRFVTGGADKAFYGAATGSSAPPGQSAIVAWGAYDSTPRALGIYNPMSGSQPEVYPAAASRDGAWLVLTNGEIWRDLDANAPLPPGAICLPGANIGDLNACVLRGKASPRLKKIAETQTAVYNQQLSGFAKAFGKTSLIEAGATTEELETVMGTAGAGLSARVVSAINARNYWQTVAQDPPDPNYRTPATPRRVNAKALKSFPGLTKKQSGSLKAWVLAQLRLASATACGVEAINRGATAYDANEPRAAIDQYQAGARCAQLAGAEAKKVAKAGPAAAKAVGALMAKARKKGAGKVRRPSAKAIARTVSRQVARTSKLLKLTTAEKKALRKALTPGKSAKPGLPNLAALIKADAKKVGQDAGPLGSSDEFMKQAVIGR